MAVPQDGAAGVDPGRGADAQETEPGASKEPRAAQAAGQEQEGRSAASALRPLDDRAVRALYLDLVGRPPFEPERQEWIGKGLDRLASKLLGTLEYWQQWFQEQLYYFLLIDNFHPAGEDVEAIPQLLTEGRLNVREAIHRIALTPSFDLRNPGADTFVTVVMEQYVGMTVQTSRRELEIGKAAYDGRSGRFLGATAESQADVVRVAVEHARSARHLVGREYERIVRRPMDRRELAQDGRRLHRDPSQFVDLVRGWLLSDAYQDRLAEGAPLSNRLFVRALFVDLMGRLPTKDETEPLRNALDGLADSRPLRSVVVKMLLDSGRVSIPNKRRIEDPTAWIAGEFRRLLGRAASPDELKLFVSVFHDPECRPATILYALLSHAEYHRS